MRKCIQKLVEGQNLSDSESRKALEKIMAGKTTNAQIAAFLTALRIKGETVSEIVALSSTMQHFCQQITPKVNGRLVDTCGTGGDRVKTFNISTTAAFVIAGAGISVAKHGNRSFTSKSGSADVLEKLGFNLNITPKMVERTIENVGIGFMYAPAFHHAMKHVIEARRDIGIRTVFNILGPLSNPANADSQLVGVFSNELVNPLAQALRKLGCAEAMVVHGLDGLDEVSTIGKTAIAWLKEGDVQTVELTPTALNLTQARSKDIAGSTPEKNAETSFNILKGHYNDHKTNIVLANAAAGIIIGGKADTFHEAMERAREAIQSGEAYKKLQLLIKTSNGDLTKLEKLESKYG
ncbi:MAG: anthranilate phosphoribosyltransferase [Candidatus Bathyarchaeota archaeon]|nr:MAG: anthranilate phosphoribosyltransferase [Candidatus Bathyarchaeota archaeon]